MISISLTFWLVPNLLGLVLVWNAFAMHRSHIYSTVAMSNQFAMHKCHIYSIAVMSILKS